MDESTKQGLGIALNEATLLGVEVERTQRMAAITLSLLSLPEGDGPPPSDRRVSLILHPVGRVAASLRDGRWDDPKAPVVPFALEDLLAVVGSFGHLPIYGWEFFDIEGQFEGLAGRLSLDEEWGAGGRSHRLHLFQENHDRHLDIWIWFDKFGFFTAKQEPIPSAAIIAGGKRWWDGLHTGDPRTWGHGIMPGIPGEFERPRGESGQEKH